MSVLFSKQPEIKQGSIQ